jgi:hypothetical protein
MADETPGRTSSRSLLPGGFMLGSAVKAARGALVRAWTRLPALAEVAAVTHTCARGWQARNVSPEHRKVCGTEHSALRSASGGIFHGKSGASVEDGQSASTESICTTGCIFPRSLHSCATCQF